MSHRSYLEAATAALRQVAETQGPRIEAAAGLLVEAIVSGHSIFSFGASHSFMTTEELVYRTGGLMLVNPIYPHGMNLFVRPITATSRLERLVGLGAEMLASSAAKEGDTLILTSTSGRNAVVIDMALEAAKRGIGTIGITSLAYTSGVASRHPSAKKLADLCDVVIDNCVPLGDAAVDVAGFPQKVGPLSSVTGCAIVNAIVAKVVAGLVARGVEPPVFMSANLDGGDAWNERLLTENRDRIHYL
ncbi:MAG TPA: SIS domain-containing protein [Fimbriimonadaceae bacterium]|nr:SIS domain-containing protein [Fimbriimonadaceae bacterium]